MGIIIKNLLIKACHFNRLDERYHGPIYQMYKIITTKLSEIKFKLTWKMFFKIFNDSIKLNSLVSILLVFGTYPRIININASLTTII